METIDFSKYVEKILEAFDDAERLHLSRGMLENDISKILQDSMAEISESEFYGTESYENAYEEGRADGYQDGYNEALEDAKEELSNLRR